MLDPVQYVDATPVLASLDIQRSTEFFASNIEFAIVDPDGNLVTFHEPAGS